MVFNLKDKVAVITGAGQGIGKAVANAFGIEGCKLAICDIDQERLDKVHEELATTGCAVFSKVVDVRNYSELQTFGDDVIRVFDQIDIWINHVGVADSKPFLEETPQDWDHVFQTNLNSFLYGSQIAGRHMKNTGGGVIISTSSYTSLLPTSCRTAYAASKAAINAATRLLGGELAPYGIRVLAIAPGSVESNLENVNKQQFNVSNIALQRTCKAEELAQTYVYLASDAASYLTSLVVEVSGGKLAIQDIELPWKRAEEE